MIRALPSSHELAGKGRSLPSAALQHIPNPLGDLSPMGATPPPLSRSRYENLEVALCRHAHHQH